MCSYKYSQLQTKTHSAYCYSSHINKYAMLYDFVFNFNFPNN